MWELIVGSVRPRMYLQREIGVHVLREIDKWGVYQGPTEANYDIPYEGIWLRFIICTAKQGVGKHREFCDLWDVHCCRWEDVRSHHSLVFVDSPSRRAKNACDLSSQPALNTSLTAHVHLQQQDSLVMSSVYPCCTLVVPLLYPRWVPNHPVWGSPTSVQRVYMLNFFCGNPLTPPLPASITCTVVQVTVGAYKLT